MDSIESDISFLIGITQRSGTNFLSRLLVRHPDVSGTPPIWEDHLIQHSRLLVEYAGEVDRSWGSDWGTHTLRDELLGDLGSGILRFLERRARPGRKHIVAKRPVTEGLEHIEGILASANCRCDSRW
ncbi:MAG: hypothetical protein O2930_14910 [Acidobacteria bacterium]|nr:hypothetical protein [Acidobacteriota bacterium]